MKKETKQGLAVAGVLVGTALAIWGITKAKAAPPRRRPPCDGIGDVNFDGWVDEKDIALAIDLMADTPTPEQLRRADVNGDGVLNTTDVTMMERYYLGLIDTFPACALL